MNEHQLVEKMVTVLSKIGSEDPVRIRTKAISLLAEIPCGGDAVLFAAIYRLPHSKREEAFKMMAGITVAFSLLAVTWFALPRLLNHLKPSLI